MEFREEESVQRIAALLTKARHAIAFTGAGISTASGIPDFRSRESGLWEKSDPLVVASLYGFRQDPSAFYQWVRPLAELTLSAQPNPAHIALAQMETCGYLKAVVTQNIDMLHTKAGSKTVYELHGHLREVTCTHCFLVRPADAVIPQFLEDGLVPHCPKCGGVFKPNVILFGEQLPVRELTGAREAMRQADVILIVGSSLEVAPASDLPMLAARHGAALVIINLEPTPADHLAQVVMREEAAVILPQIAREMGIVHD